MKDIRNGMHFTEAYKLLLEYYEDWEICEALLEDCVLHKLSQPYTKHLKFEKVVENIVDEYELRIEN